jgi:hypothetical protein
LNVDVSSHFFQSAEHLQLRRIHGGVTRTKSEILINLLESIEGRVQYCEAPLKNCAVPEGVDIASVNCVGEMTNLRTGTIAWDTFSINGLFLRWTSSDTSTVVFQEVLGTFFDTSGSVSIFSLWISLPLVLDRVVYLHRRALLFANPVVVKILAGQAIRLLWTRAPAGTEKMTAFSGLWTKTSPRVALGSTVDF